jgi:hypothetical protein
MVQAPHGPRQSGWRSPASSDPEKLFDPDRPERSFSLFERITNLGLALVDPHDTSQNPFMTAHKRIGERHPGILVNSRRPWYVRSVHADNDSRALHDTDLLEGETLAESLRRFPFLDGQLTAS